MTATADPSITGAAAAADLAPDDLATAGVDPAPCALARDEHHPPRQPCPPQPGQDRRSAATRRPRRRCVSILTALYFHYLNGQRPRRGQAARLARLPCRPVPARHLPTASYLTELRAFHGLQSYPSRTKDPDPVDFSTGSVGLGAVAPLFAAADRPLRARSTSATAPHRRFIALVGDAELDEGNVWEAVAEESAKVLGNVLWIVDLNRQSLDRVVPGIRAAQLKALFAGQRLAGAGGEVRPALAGGLRAPGRRVRCASASTT